MLTYVNNVQNVKVRLHFKTKHCSSFTPFLMSYFLNPVVFFMFKYDIITHIKTKLHSFFSIYYDYYLTF